MRNYDNIIDRLNTIDLPMKVIGMVSEYPIHVIHLESSANNHKNILITGGVHGDEPAGIEAVLHFLERNNSSLLKHFRFTIIPCINPYGYVHDIRENRDGIDINRSFETNDVLEVAIVKKILCHLHFSLAIDFHEDYEAKGFYLYEGKRNGKHIGTELADRVKTIGAIDSDDSGEDTTAISQGVYKVSPNWGTQGLIPYLLQFHSEHVIITETPTVWSLEKRAALHLGVLDAALTHH